MTIKAGGRVALIAATGLLACVVGVSWTVAASNAAEQKSEYVSTSKKVKQVRYYKRYAHRKYTHTAQKSSEEKKAGITDINHFAYPTFAKAARLRRDNLQNSQQDLLQQRTMAETILTEAEAELSKAEALESRDAKGRESDTGLRSAMIG